MDNSIACFVAVAKIFVIKHESLSYLPLFLYDSVAFTGTVPERGDAIDSISPDRKWVPHCFADETLLRYC